jgi:hypothetical protein
MRIGILGSGLMGAELVSRRIPPRYNGPRADSPSSLNPSVALALANRVALLFARAEGLPRLPE